MLENIFLTLVFTHVFLSTLCNYKLVKKVNKLERFKNGVTAIRSVHELITTYERMQEVRNKYPK